MYVGYLPPLKKNKKKKKKEPVTRCKMNNLDGLNAFLTERLMAVAGEIFDVFKDAFSDYQSEIERIKQENRCLKDSLAEIYNGIQERTEKHSLTQTALITDIQVNLELEASPKKSDPQPCQKDEHTCTSKPAHLDEDQDPESSFPHASAMNDESRDTGDLHIKSSCTIKVEPGADGTGQVKEEAEGHQGTEQQEILLCTYCNHTFAEVHELTSHIQSHLALFTCELCGKSFKQKGTLKTHMIVHQKERPFACAYCKKRFKLKSHLKEHERIHTGEKPFSCPVCMMSFTRSNPLKRHLRNHHREQF